MSVYRDISAEVIRRGEATTDQLLLIFPKLTRQQIKDGLRNGKAEKLVMVLREGQRDPDKQGAGAEPAVWGPYVDAEDYEPAPIKVDTSKWKRPCSFVFDLGRA